MVATAPGEKLLIGEGEEMEGERRGGREGEGVRPLP